MSKKRDFRDSTLDERKEFYEKEFSIAKVKKWFKKNKISIPQICALDAGTDTGIILKKEWKGKMFYFPFRELKKQIKKYVPEDIYYDRNVYEKPNKVLKNLDFSGRIKQELVFDIDADNIDCNCKKDRVCNVCLRKAYSNALKMKKLLQKKFKKIKIVYSGKGFHLHALDEKAWQMKDSQRQELNKELKRFPIDEWVSAGHIRLIRMPYSLNSLVSRIVTPLSRDGKINWEETIPDFMK